MMKIKNCQLMMVLFHDIVRLIYDFASVRAKLTKFEGYVQKLLVKTNPRKCHIYSTLPKPLMIEPNNIVE